MYCAIVLITGTVRVMRRCICICVLWRCRLVPATQSHINFVYCKPT